MSLTAKLHKAVQDWAKQELSPVQQHALRKLVTTGTLSPQDKERLFHFARAHAGLETLDVTGWESSVQPLELPETLTFTKPIKLRAIKNLRNVNALRESQQLPIGDHLTVVYGENGTGKSGYSRVLKAVARCAEKAVETILPNVFEESAQQKPATATFEIEDSGKILEVTWENGKQSPKELKRFAVFDGKCGRMILTGPSQLSFKPSVLDALETLGGFTAELKEMLAQFAAKSAPSAPPAFQFMVDQTAVGRTLATISATTDIAVLDRLSAWSENDENELRQKELDVATLRESSPKKATEALNRSRLEVQAIERSVLKNISRIGNAAVQSLRSAVEAYTVAEQAYNAAVAAATTGSKLSGVGSEAWRSLLVAAERFSRSAAYPGTEFPNPQPEALCVLCQQPVTAAAQDRLSNFWQFLQGEAAKAVQAAKAKRDNLVSTAGEAKAFENLDPTFSEREPSVWNGFSKFEDCLMNRKALVESALTDGLWNDIPTLDESVAEACLQRIHEIDTMILQLTADVGTETRIQALTSEIAEYNARKRLAGNFALVREHVEALKRTEKARRAAEAIRTNNISIKAKSLHTKYVSDAFTSNVASRVQNLGIRNTKLRVSEKSDRGKVLHQITVASSNKLGSADAVFSEGERTAISLAFFLADLGSVEETCGVIFDDPVTSLDHRIRAGVIKMLVREAKVRQVIVFTHDLSFYCELMAQAERDQIPQTSVCIEDLDGAPGFIEAKEPWEALSLDKRVAKLDEAIVQAKKLASEGNPEAFDMLRTRFYSRLRASWERAVEELLFNKVVQRYDRAVKTLSLVGVCVDQEAVSAVFAAMTRCSGLIDGHDHAVGVPMEKPTSEDMTKDLNDLRDFIKQQKEKRKKTEAMNGHLKPKSH